MGYQVLDLTVIEELSKCILHLIASFVFLSACKKGPDPDPGPCIFMSVCVCVRAMVMSRPIIGVKG